jgi:type IV secretory pathway VirB2 component (pilin)
MMVIILISGISSWRRYIWIIIGVILKLGSTNSNKYLTSYKQLLNLNSTYN